MQFYRKASLFLCVVPSATRKQISQSPSIGWRWKAIIYLCFQLYSCLSRAVAGQCWYSMCQWTNSLDNSSCGSHITVASTVEQCNPSAFRSPRDSPGWLSFHSWQCALMISLRTLQTLFFSIFNHVILILEMSKLLVPTWPFHCFFFVYVSLNNFSTRSHGWLFSFVLCCRFLVNFVC